MESCLRENDVGTDWKLQQLPKTDGDFTKWVVRVLTISVIIIGSLLGSATLIGLVTVVLGFDDPANILIGYGFMSVIGDVSREEIQCVGAIYHSD